MILIGNDEFPSLKFFAQKQVLRNLDEILPCSKTSMLVENTSLQSRIVRLERNAEKFSLRLRRRRSRIRESLHEIMYVSHKMIEIADAIQDERLHYAESELRTLSDLNSCETTLRSLLSLIEVSFCYSCSLQYHDYLVFRICCKNITSIERKESGNIIFATKTVFGENFVFNFQTVITSLQAEISSSVVFHLIMFVFQIFVGYGDER